VRGYKQKRDRNEIPIIEGLDKNSFGARRVYPPCDFDLLVSHSDTPFLLPMECKMPGGTITDGQATQFSKWPDLIVYAPEQATDVAKKYFSLLLAAHRRWIY
jgi:hypothetical protein